MKHYLIRGTVILVTAASFASSQQVSIPNFHSVEEKKIYRGARPEASGIEELAKLGIRTVVDLQGGDKILGIPTEAGESDEGIAQEGQEVRDNGMKFVSIPLSAINPDVDDETTAIDLALDIISDPENQPVFFHCRHGSDRTGLVAALYRVFYQGCTPDQAHKEMMEDGHSSAMPWLDDYFEDRVQADPRTHMDKAAATCPLPQR